MVNPKTPNNPAGRLHKIMKETHGADPKKMIITVLAEHFGTDPADVGMGYEQVIEILQLTREAEDQLKRFVPEPQLFAEPLHRVREAFHQYSPRATWNHVAQIVSQDVIKEIAKCDALLAVHSAEAPVDLKALEEIGARIDALLDEVAKSEFPADMKDTVHRHLLQLRHYLYLYRTRGVDGLKFAAEQAFGGVVVTIQEAAETLNEKDKSTYSSVVDIVMRVAKLTTAGQSILSFYNALPKPLRDTVEGLLPQLPAR